jgi:tetratricopeptide (TPR) repeat protein
MAFREERVREAIGFLEEAVAAHRGQLLHDPSAVDTLGRAYAASGDLESAIALYTSALAQARESNASIEQLRFAVLLANCLIDHGTWGDAEQTLADVIALASNLHDPLAEARVFWSQSRLHVLRGETALAARYARRALAILERTENQAYVAMAYHLLAYAEIEEGNGRGALDLLERGRALFGDDMTDRDRAKFALEEARALSLVGETAAAAKAGRRALGLIEWIDPQDRGRAYMHLGDIFAANGDRDRARDVYETAVDLLEAHGKPYLLDAAAKLAAQLEEDGDAPGALAVLKRATAARRNAPPPPRRL